MNKNVLLLSIYFWVAAWSSCTMYFSAEKNTRNLYIDMEITDSLLSLTDGCYDVVIFYIITLYNL